MLCIEVFHKPPSQLEHLLTNADFEEILEFYRYKHDEQEGIDDETALRDFLEQAEAAGIQIDENY